MSIIDILKSCMYNMRCSNIWNKLFVEFIM